MAEEQKKLPPPLSRFRVHNGTLYISGQVPIKDGAIISDDFAEQARQTLENVRAVVIAGGGTLEGILKCNCYVRHEKDMETFNQIYRDFFGGSAFPARTTLIAAPPNPRVLVEVEAIAAI